MDIPISNDPLKENSYPAACVLAQSRCSQVESQE